MASTMVSKLEQPDELASDRDSLSGTTLAWGSPVTLQKRCADCAHELPVPEDHVATLMLGGGAAALEHGPCSVCAACTVICGEAASALTSHVVIPAKGDSDWRQLCCILTGLLKKVGTVSRDKLAVEFLLGKSKQNTEPTNLLTVSSNPRLGNSGSSGSSSSHCSSSIQEALEANLRVRDTKVPAASIGSPSVDVAGQTSLQSGAEPVAVAVPAKLNNDDGDDGSDFGTDEDWSGQHAPLNKYSMDARLPAGPKFSNVQQMRGTVNNYASEITRPHWFSKFKIPTVQALYHRLSKYNDLESNTNIDISIAYRQLEVRCFSLITLHRLIKKWTDEQGDNALVEFEEKSNAVDYVSGKERNTSWPRFGANALLWQVSGGY